MTIAIDATPTLTIILYPELDRVVWIMGIEKKVCTTTLAVACVEMQAEANRRKYERSN